MISNIFINIVFCPFEVLIWHSYASVGRWEYESSFMEGRSWNFFIPPDTSFLIPCRTYTLFRTIDQTIYGKKCLLTNFLSPFQAITRDSHHILHFMLLSMLSFSLYYDFFFRVLCSASDVQDHQRWREKNVERQKRAKSIHCIERLKKEPIFHQKGKRGRKNENIFNAVRKIFFFFMPCEQFCSYHTVAINVGHIFASKSKDWNVIRSQFSHFFFSFARTHTYFQSNEQKK